MYLQKFVLKLNQFDAKIKKKNTHQKIIIKTYCKMNKNHRKERYSK